MLLNKVILLECEVICFQLKILRQVIEQAQVVYAYIPEICKEGHYNQNFTERLDFTFGNQIIIQLFLINSYILN